MAVFTIKNKHFLYRQFTFFIVTSRSTSPKSTSGICMRAILSRPFLNPSRVLQHHFRYASTLKSTMDTYSVPEGFTLHSENTARILLPSNNEAFLNPIQEFNRDISVACITVWSEEREREKEKRWKQKLDNASRKKSKKDPHHGRSYLLFLLSSTFNTSSSVAPPQNDVDIQMGNSDPGPSTQPSSSTLKVC